MTRRCLWFVLFAGGAALTTSVLVNDGRLWGQPAQAPSISADSDSFVFVLDLQGQQVEFTECSGLGSSHEIDEQPAVTTTGSVVVQSTPGALRRHRITLKRATPGNAAIWQWRKTMETTGLASALREGRITLYGAGSSVPLAQWTFTKGWPASLVFDGSQEELVIVHEGLERGATTGGGAATRS